MTMNNLHIAPPFVEMPSEIQDILYLIKEELKSRKFFNALQTVGLDGSYFQPHLDTFILKSLDMDDDTDETFDTYYKIIERRSEIIEANDYSITKQALEVYNELLIVKKGLVNGKKAGDH